MFVVICPTVAFPYVEYDKEIITYHGSNSWDIIPATRMEQLGHTWRSCIIATQTSVEKKSQHCENYNHQEGSLHSCKLRFREECTHTLGLMFANLQAIEFLYLYWDQSEQVQCWCKVSAEEYLCQKQSRSAALEMLQRSFKLAGILVSYICQTKIILTN